MRKLFCKILAIFREESRKLWLSSICKSYIAFLKKNEGLSAAKHNVEAGSNNLHLSEVTARKNYWRLYDKPTCDIDDPTENAEEFLHAMLVKLWPGNLKNIVIILGLLFTLCTSRHKVHRAATGFSRCSFLFQHSIGLLSLTEKQWQNALRQWTGHKKCSSRQFRTTPARKCVALKSAAHMLVVSKILRCVFESLWI